VQPFDVACDIGGAFVDLVATGAERRIAKVPRRDVPLAALVQDALAAARIAPAQVARLRLSTTLAANALIAGGAAPVALVATQGFVDLPELGRQSRRDPDLWPCPPPTPPWLSPESWRIGLPGRIDARGQEVAPLALDALDAVRALPPGTPVALCLLFAHRNPAHEIAAAARIAALRPDLPLSLSHRVDPQPREFERMLATLVDASLKPLAAAFDMEGLPAPWLMRAEGGVMPMADAMARPLGLVQSGPSAGALGFAALGAEIGLDIGSTTTEVSLHRAGAPLAAREVLLPDLALRCATLDVTSLPFGGDRARDPLALAWLAEQVRRIALRRSIDPAGATLAVGGGAGPGCAEALAAQLNPAALLVPEEARVIAAAGLAAAPAMAREDAACDLPLAELPSLQPMAEAQAARLHDRLRSWGVAAPVIRHELDLAPGPRAEPIAVAWQGDVAAAYRAAALAQRGQVPPGAPRILALRCVATGALP
jgi:N-methylhydantoinase A